MGNLLDQETRIPVLIQIEPARLGLKDLKEETIEIRERMNKMIASGLHGFISSGNLLTGSKFIEIQYVEDTHSKEQYFSGYQVIPTAASEIDNLLQKLDNIFATLDQLPLNDLVGNVSETMKEMKTAMIDFSAASTQVDQFLDNSEGKAMIANVNKTLRSIEVLAKGFSEGSKTHQDISAMLQSLEGALKELTPVLSQLNHQPNSLLFGGAKEADVEPRGKEND